MELVVSPTGEITTLYTESLDLAALGDLTITRASQVEPDDNGQWRAHLLDGPSLGPFARRSAALVAEVAWLEVHRLGCAHGRQFHRLTRSCTGPGGSPLLTSGRSGSGLP